MDVMDQGMTDEVRKVRGLSDLLQRHLLGIQMEYSKNGKRESEIISAFLLSVMDEWIVVTAGHCIDCVKEIRSRGYKLENSYLIDGMGISPRFTHTIPFNYDDADPESFDSLGFDVGTLRLTGNQRQLLEANRKSPIDELAWDLQPQQYDSLMLLGIPHELTEQQGSRIVYSPSLYWVDETQDAEDFRETGVPTMYGVVRLNDKIHHDIKGVSGGPIFAFRTDASGTRYWLVALQSSWIKADRRISAPKTRSLGIGIARVLGEGLVTKWNARPAE